MSHDDDDPDAWLFEDFMRELNEEFPAFRVVEKRTDRFSRLIDRALRIVTLGGQKSYISSYYTVIGYTLYVPDGWKSTPCIDRIITLHHERIHLRQRRRYTFLGMAFIYLVPFFPLGLAYGRARIEWEAFRETLRATLRFKGVEALQSEFLRHHIVSQFLGPNYGWMWPFRNTVERWYDDHVARLLAEELVLENAEAAAVD